MSSKDPFQTLELTVHFTDNLPEEQEQFWEALEWVRRHFADALRVHLHLLNHLTDTAPTLPPAGGALLVVASRQWQLAPADPNDPTEALIAQGVKLGAQEREHQQAPLQLGVFFEGLVPEETPIGITLEGRLKIKGGLAATPGVLLETFDRPDELKRQLVETLMGLCERLSRGALRHQQAPRKVTFPQALLNALRPARIEVDAMSLKADPVGAAMAEASNALALSLEGHWVEAELSFLDSLTAHQDLNVIKAWGHYLLQVRRYALAAKVWREIIHQCHELGDRLAEAEGFYYLSLCHSRRGQTEVAIVEAREAVDHFAQLGASQTKVDALLLLAELLVRTHKQKEAQKIYDQAITLTQTLQKTQDTALIWLKKGMAHQQLEELQQADHCYHQALPLLEKTKGVDKRALARAYIQKGSLDSQRRLYAMAERNYERAAEIFHKLDDVEGMADITGYLAKVAMLQGEAARSLLLLRCALALESAQEDYEGLGMNHLSMGVLRGQTGERSEALRHLKAARALFELSGAVAKETIASHMVALISGEAEEKG